MLPSRSPGKTDDADKRLRSRPDRAPTAGDHRNQASAPRTTGQGRGDVQRKAAGGKDHVDDQPRRRPARYGRRVLLGDLDPERDCHAGLGVPH